MPSEYGLVFGIFELTVFLVSPIIGANLNRMGMKMTLNVGIGTVGVSSILFGIFFRINTSQWARKFKKLQAKKTREIKSINFHLLQFHKWPKINF